MTLRVVCMLPVLGQPRFAKRVAMLQSEGADVSCLAFDRPYHKGRQPPCAVDTLGTVPHGRYLARLGVFLRALRTLRRTLQGQPVMYCFGLDMLLLVWFAGLGLRRTLVLEVGDVREIQTAAGWKGALFRRFDRWLVSRANLVVFTAEDFYQQYYRGWLGCRLHHQVIENKLEQAPVLSPDQREPGDAGVLTIGYFGLIRCAWSVRALAALADAYPSGIRIRVAGYSLLPKEELAALADRPNVEVAGEYRSPDDLPDLYGAVDLVWACYAPLTEDNWNLRWARTNRFYEACAFRRPMIVRAGSNDGKSARAYDIGLLVDCDSPQGLVAAFGGVNGARMAQWRRNLDNLDTSVFAYTDEAALLCSAMRKAAERLG